MLVSRTLAAAAATGIVALASAAGSAHASTLVYSNDFEGSVTGWNKPNKTVTPVGGRGFLGEFGNDTVVLPLNNLAGHSEVTLSFDLYILRSWDGNNTHPGVGPDIWSVGAMHGEMGEHVLLATTFSAQPMSHNRAQAYPLAYGDGNSPMYAGASEVNSLGYIHTNRDMEYALSSVYHMSFTFEHSESSLELWFRAAGLQSLADESWGLDNVNVSINGVPAPGAVALLGLGGLAMGRRRR